MMPLAVLSRIVATVFCVVGCTSATAAPATAIFPFEIYDTSGEPPRPDLAERLAMTTRVLSEALEKTGRYSPVDLGPFSADVAATSPRYLCGDCFLPIARRAGAAYAVVPVVHKVSSLISSMDIWILDTSSGLRAWGALPGSQQAPVRRPIGRRRTCKIARIQRDRPPGLDHPASRTACQRMWSSMNVDTK
jgi:hypothetical protein